MSKKPTTFQDIILRLQEFWRDQGCLVRYPYNVQVGAGTMNPATSLYVLGPEPWNVVYVEPSIRPDDGRFGDNPNRMQMHHQLQVILKPDPGNPQELYLQSLEAIGIDPREHDVRFVEDNWESPALGAWGLGWEVWLDGQEITQFTYFQQSGGVNLDPVSVEITYGLDRIVLALQKKTAVWHIDYNEAIRYADVFLRSEIEHCQYYFNVADVDALKQVYDTYEREAQRCIDAKLVVPAHDYNLKCSHLFNVLDTRGAIGVTERANYFKRMRNVARQVSELFIEQRQWQEYPLLDVNSVTAAGSAVSADSTPAPTAPAAFVLEIGSEELPAGDVSAGVTQLRALLAARLDALRLDYAALDVYGTPRRLSAVVHGLAPMQTTVEEEVKGPPADRAFDAAGKPTKAAEGFARSRGVTVADLSVREEGDRRYVVALVRQEGRPTVDVLAEALPGLIADIRFDKSMRWNAANVPFSRPLRWFVALFGSAVVPFEYAGIAAGRISRGLRPYGSPPVVIDDAANYAAIMRENRIVLDPADRQALIAAQSAELAAAVAGTIPANPGLIEEITNLVESPVPFRGTFEQRYLALPEEILVAVMRKHQRYFPVRGRTGKLLPHFIAVRNGDDAHLDIVTDGNEQVIRARFADAEFFYNQDKQRRLVDFRDDLHKLTFQFDLGSMLDKTTRIEQLIDPLARLLALDDDDTAVARRAAHLAKADLATGMVIEMTSLQGIMGGYYARLSGEPEAVAAAIVEQYNAVSATRPGLALALADRIDSLVGLTAAGLLPKGANDPFALRRAAIQIIENLVSNGVALDLRAAFTAAMGLMPVPVTAAHVEEALAFVAARLEVVLRDQGYRSSVVKAVMAAQATNPFAATTTVQALADAVEADDWMPVLEAYARCVRITRAYSEPFALDEGGLTDSAETTLLAAYRRAAAAMDGTLPTLVANLRAMVPAITTFFDNILVMAEDDAVRTNRLALLQRIAALADGIADLSELEGF